MGCSDVCIDMDYDGDSNEFIRQEMRRARKEHTCCECRAAIMPGARYEYASGKAGGDMWQAKTCILCYEIRRALVCGGWVFGMLWEEIEQTVFPEWKNYSPIDCLARIESLEARNKLRTEYAIYLGETL